MLSRSFGYCVCLLALISSASPVAAQDELSALPRSFPALQLTPEEQIELDGLLTESAWDRAEPAGEFIQQEPTEGGVPTERTEVYVLYSRDVLYIGAILYDSEPEGILGHQKQRDQGLGSDDRFMWMLDTFLDGRTGYFFETNPAGLLGDGLMRASSGRFGVSKEWDGIWNVKTAHGDYGWSLEIEIPFRTLNFDESLDTWGINFQRTVRRKQEEMLWSGHRRNQGLFRAIHAGRLTGLTGITQGLGLEVKPYGATAWREVVDEGTEVPADVGFDLNYNLTSSLKTAVSVNTDFAETEVDRRRVNLTRFPLFFPEQRDFFLENGGVFSFSRASGVIPFFSRTIGLAGGKEVPIVFGSRLTGQAGAHDLGFLQVRTDESDELGTEDFTIGRVKRNFWRQSTIGAIYTRRATGALEEDLGPLDRHTVGADLDLVTSTFLGDKNLQFEAFYVWHNDPERDGTSGTADRSARGIRFNYPNDIWRAHVSFRELGDAFESRHGLHAAQRLPSCPAVAHVGAAARAVGERPADGVRGLLRAPARPGKRAADAAHQFHAVPDAVPERRLVRGPLQQHVRATRGAVRDQRRRRAADRGVSLQRVPVRRPHGQSADGLGQHRLQEGGVLVGERQVDELRPYRQAAPGDHALDQLPAR